MQTPPEPSSIFNGYFEGFMRELQLAFPGNASVEAIAARFHDMAAEDPEAPARRMAADMEPAMQTLMTHNAKTAGEPEMNAVLRRIGQTEGLLAGLEVPEQADGGAQAVAAMLQNKAGTIEYVRNSALTAIGLANMPPGMMSMISSIGGLLGDEDGAGADGEGPDMASMMRMIGPMLGPLMGSMAG